MRRCVLAFTALLLPAALAAQSPAARESPRESRPESPDGVMFAFGRFADIFGGRLVAAFDSIPAGRYGYRPTPAQQTVGLRAAAVIAADTRPPWGTQNSRVSETGRSVSR